MQKAQGPGVVEICTQTLFQVGLGASSDEQAMAELRPVRRQWPVVEKRLDVPGLLSRFPWRFFCRVTARHLPSSLCLALIGQFIRSTVEQCVRYRRPIRKKWNQCSRMGWKLHTPDSSPYYPPSRAGNRLLTLLCTAGSGTSPVWAIKGVPILSHTAEESLGVPWEHPL